MRDMFDKMRLTVGLGLNEDELYNRAFEKGVLLKDFNKAADTFNEAAKKAAERENQAMVAQATANALLYRYLATRDASILPALMQALTGLPQIERIGLQGEVMPTEPLRAELDCRMVEAMIMQVRDDVMRSRDLHKLASEKFQTILRNPLITYEYVQSGFGHDERTDERFYYHDGMFRFYEAMTKKDSDPSAASSDLSLAQLAFRRCNDPNWLQKVSVLLDNWRISRTCWLCHRKIQGYELHFSLCNAHVTPYTKRLIEVLNEDPSAIDVVNRKIAVCSPCGSMVTFKAAEEAEKVRRELTVKLDSTLNSLQNLERRVNSLELRSRLG